MKRQIISYNSVFANCELQIGDPVSVVSGEYDRPIVGPYDGKTFAGISLNNVVNIDLTRYGSIDISVGGLIHVATVGMLTLPKVPYAVVNGFIKPSKRYKWKATKKLKKKSVGRIVKIDGIWMEVVLL
jgi:hypothetical protein